MDISPTLLEDTLRIPPEKVTVSLAVSFYFKPPAKTFVAGMLRCYEAFLARCEPHLRWCADEVSGKYRQAHPSILRLPMQRALDAVEADRFYAWMATSGQAYQDASPYQFHGIFSESSGWGEGLLGHVRMAFDPGLFRIPPGAFLSHLKESAADLSVYHGQAGFSFSESMSRGRQQSNEHLVLKASERFVGVEVEGDGASRRCCQDAIKGVNWLTFIAGPFVDRLGGMRALETQLGSDIVVHPMPWGVLIQAGPEPQVGDTAAEDTLSLYRRVNKVLRPIRVGVHSNLGVVFDEEQTRRWIERLDEPTQG